MEIKMKLGFIGTGNMAEAIISGVIQNGLFNKDEILGSDPSSAGRNKVKSAYNIHVTDNNIEVAQQSDVIILAVKPQYYESVIIEIKDVIKDNQLIVTIAPGKTLAWLSEKFCKKIKIIRTMPNTPAMVGQGMTAVCANENVMTAELDYICKILQCFGQVELIPEKLMDAVVAVSGSSPAYVFILIEAMADAAVREGMPRQQAYKFAAQAVLGSAKMILETGKHPGELKDMVCSPAGTTIEAVRILEAKGIRSAIMEAMKACAEVARNL
jgi:pyrroline-5-carboxylate reductase